MPHSWRRVHVHPGHGDEALHPGAAGADSRAADVQRRAAAPRARAADRSRDARALSAHEVRRPEALFGRGRAHDDPDARSPDPARRRAGRAGDRDRHGAPRPPERARQYARQDARGSLLRVRRQALAGVHRRRRQVSPGLLVRRRDARRPDASHACVQSVASRDRQSGRRGLGTRAPAPPGRRQGRRRASRADPWRRRGGRAGREPGSAQHGADARLLHRRNDPHRRQQPDRLHDVRPPRHARHHVLHRHRQDGRGADPARQRRRPGSVPARDRDRARLPAAVPSRRLHRPRLLPPPGAQRSRRADGDAAAHVQEDRATPGNAAVVRRQAGRRRRDRGGGARSDDRDLSHGDGQGPAYQYDDPVELQAAVHDRLVFVQGQELEGGVHVGRARSRRSRRCRSGSPRFPKGSSCTRASRRS